ncbi:5'-nucleotidase domain containing 1 [Salpingoeca rosetta]|uniref:5'-nucleotidase domain containing 1 n=1 Tax=Salpingoeca rosetta (strain ATCC 50818 / BSB-021) TaxID=946362 RepID=F2UCR0_SALR5|nr:5'-nucleotidase domain containing 1 [Salpingoeca rosetta]EGD74367.1 5'-nucleotidase domain containing 1 [Salpingoeca rosetta]|eukprot:XP_004993267.1 5'-nucleotidase domain containing 1 [Salpingoeca rosetta]
MAEVVDLGACDWLGFDLDHTLVRYNVPALTDLIHESVAAFLVQYRNYDAAAFTSKADPAFFVKGLLFDAEKGNFLRLRADGHIIAASHGTHRLSAQQAQAMYSEAGSKLPVPPSSPALPGSPTTPRSRSGSGARSRSGSGARRLRRGPSQHVQPQSRGHRRAEEEAELRTHALADICKMLLEEGVKHSRFFYFSTFFDMPSAAALAQAIDAVDEKRRQHHAHNPLKRSKNGDDVSAKHKEGTAPATTATTHGDGGDGGTTATTAPTSAATTTATTATAATSAATMSDAPAHWFAGSYTHVLQDLKDALTHNFTPSQFAVNGGFFFPQLKQHTERYVHVATSTLVQWLADMRANAVRLFLLTNSHVDLATFLMDYSFGKEWRAKFDLVIFAGAKPGFFEKSDIRTRAAFFTPVGCSNVTGPEAEELQLGGAYVHGNYTQLQAFLDQHRNTHAHAHAHTEADTMAGTTTDTAAARDTHARVMYFGDHITGDIMAAERHTCWQTVAVVEELVTLNPAGPPAAPSSPSSPSSSSSTVRCPVHRADTAIASFLLDSLDRWGHLIHPHESTAATSTADDGDGDGQGSGRNPVTTSTPSRKGKQMHECTLFEAVLRNHAAFAVPHMEALVSSATTTFASFAAHDSTRGVHHHDYTVTATSGGAESTKHMDTAAE